MEFILNEYHRDIPDEELIADIRRVATLLGEKNLTQKYYRENGNYGVNTLRRRFGSWRNVLELCGKKANVYQVAASLSGHTSQIVETDDLLKDIKRIALLLEKETISSREYHEHGIYSRDTCYRRFGTWNEALKQAGLKPFVKVPGQRIADENLLREIERIWIKLGRQPTSSDIKTGISHYSLHTYAEHFGGWRGALQAFLKYINEEEHPTEYISKEKPVTEGVVVKRGASKKKTVIRSQTEASRHKTPRDVNYRLRFKVMQRDNFKCCLCGKSPAKDPSVELHVDHIFPWAKGGETVMDNLQTLCSNCNLGKGDLVL